LLDRAAHALGRRCARARGLLRGVLRAALRRRALAGRAARDRHQRTREQHPRERDLPRPAHGHLPRRPARRLGPPPGARGAPFGPGSCPSGSRFGTHARWWWRMASMTVPTPPTHDAPDGHVAAELVRLEEEGWQALRAGGGGAVMFFDGVLDTQVT